MISSLDLTAILFGIIVLADLPFTEHSTSPCFDAVSKTMIKNLGLVTEKFSGTFVDIVEFDNMKKGNVNVSNKLKENSVEKSEKDKLKQLNDRGGTKMGPKSPRESVNIKGHKSGTSSESVSPKSLDGKQKEDFEMKGQRSDSSSVAKTSKRSKAKVSDKDSRKGGRAMRRLRGSIHTIQALSILSSKCRCFFYYYYLVAIFVDILAFLKVCCIYCLTLIMSCN